MTYVCRCNVRAELEKAAIAVLRFLSMFLIGYDLRQAHPNSQRIFPSYPELPIPKSMSSFGPRWMYQQMET